MVEGLARERKWKLWGGECVTMSYRLCSRQNGSFGVQFVIAGDTKGKTDRRKAICSNICIGRVESRERAHIRSLS